MSEPVGSQLGDAIAAYLSAFYAKEQVGKSRKLARKNGITLEQMAASGLAAYLLERFDVWAKQPFEPLPPPPEPAGKSKEITVTLWMRVENNSKFVRGKKKVREEIERYVLSRYGMRKEHPDDWEYTLTIPYDTDEELESIIEDDILGEAHRLADDRNCFVEADMASVEDPDRSW